MGFQEQVLTVYETVVEQACSFRREGREVTTTFFLVCSDRTVLLPSESLPSDKEQLAAFVQTAVALLGARYVIHATEAWVSRIADGKAPSEQPDRAEVILVMVEGQGLRRIATIPILPGNTLGERTDCDTFDGRFSNLTNSNSGPTNSEDYH